MIGSAPESTAPWTQLSPTPPVPTTATLLPGGTCAVFTTAPRPVITPQASSDALSSGSVSGIATTWDSSTTATSAKAAVRSPWCTPAPSRVRMCGRSSRAKGVGHTVCAPFWQKKQCPQARIRVTTTWSPGRTSFTPGPTASTTPAASWP